MTMIIHGLMIAIIKTTEPVRKKPCITIIETIGTTKSIMTKSCEKRETIQPSRFESKNYIFARRTLSVIDP